MARVIAISLNPALDLSIQLNAVQPGEVNRSETSRMDALTIGTWRAATDSSSTPSPTSTGTA